MTSHYTQKNQKEFICIDRDPEFIPGTQPNTNGALMYFVECTCGGNLPCGPYVSGRELRCVHQVRERLALIVFQHEHWKKKEAVNLRSSSDNVDI